MIEQRLLELRAEFERGQQKVSQLRQEQQALAETMLRIAGAIQVLEELQAALATPAGQGMMAEAAD